MNAEPATKNYLTRDIILAAVKLPTADVDCPEWGGTVKVRSMTGAERDAFEASMLTEKGEQRKDKFMNVRAKLVAQVIVCDDGVTSMFTEKDVEALGRTSAAALNRVFEAARKLSGFTQKDVEELEGN